MSAKSMNQCVVCKGTLTEKKGRRHDNGICGKGSRIWVDKSTWYCGKCGLAYEHWPVLT